MNRREFVQGVVGATTVNNSFLAFAVQSKPPRQIAYYLDQSAGPAAAFGVQAIERACEKKGVGLKRVQVIDDTLAEYLLVISCRSDQASPMGQLSTQLGAPTPRGKESFVIQRGMVGNKNIALVCGADTLALAYALYSIADLIETGESPQSALMALRNQSESPAVRDRSLSMYTMQQAYFESRLFDETFWDVYLNNLVRNRFNNFSLLFAYESSGFLAPPYPWFFELPEFPEVKAAGVTPEAMQRYLHALNRIITMTHERGLRFTLGIWDHIYDGHSSYYTKGVWDHLPMINGRRPLWPVEGLTDSNLVAYTPRALERFLQLVPEIDAIQFRMHGESGLNKAGLKNFWVPVFEVMAATSPKIQFDARAKEFPLDLAYTALDMGVNLRLATKYCAEQVGMPFHATHVQYADQFGTRTSYSDMLRYPQRYQVQWRLWTSGTFRILLWGSPDFARRFAESTHLYDGDGFEVTEPLGTKMASKPHDEQPLALLNAPYRFYDYEFQRYWPFFFAFGRMAYGLPAGDDTWARLFELHFGHAAAPQVQRALELASDILPRIVAYSFPLSKFPATRGWPERQRWEDLPEYAAAEPNDIGVFASFDEETTLVLEGGSTPKVRLAETSRWFAERAKEVLCAANKAESLAQKPLSKEMVCTLTDLRILAHLAEYHEQRIHAGLAYSLYSKCGDLFALDEAIEHEEKASQQWQRIVVAAGDVYARDLAMGLEVKATPTHEPGDLSGHWIDEIPKLKLGIERLNAERDTFHPGRKFVGSYVFDASSAVPGEHQLAHQRTFSIPVPDGRYALEFEVRQDYNKDDRAFGPMWLEADGSDRTAAFTVPSGQMATQELTTEARDGRLAILLGNESMSEAILTRMRVYRLENVLAHVPIRTIPIGAGIDIRATVSGSESIRKVEVVWTGSNGDQTVRELNATAPHRYTLVLPSELCAEGGAYFLRATDVTGREFTYPERGAAGAIGVNRSRKALAPDFAHTRIHNAQSGQALRIAARVHSAIGLRSVTLRYRSVTQFQNYFSVQMRAIPGTDDFYAVVAGEHIPPEWDFMYFFEIIDNDGNGWIRPNAEIEKPYVVVKLDRSQV